MCVVCVCVCVCVSVHYLGHRSVSLSASQSVCVIHGPAAAAAALRCRRPSMAIKRQGQSGMAEPAARPVMAASVPAAPGRWVWCVSVTWSRRSSSRCLWIFATEKRKKKIQAKQGKAGRQTTGGQRHRQGNQAKQAAPAGWAGNWQRKRRPSPFGVHMPARLLCATLRYNAPYRISVLALCMYVPSVSARPLPCCWPYSSLPMRQRLFLSLLVSLSATACAVGVRYRVCYMDMC